MEKFRWLYVGSGNIAKQTAFTVTRGNHRISCVFGRNEEKVKAFAKKYGAKAYTDYDAALKSGDFDAVYIATPHTSHKDYAVRALEAGIPVLCEKPVGVRSDEVEEIIGTAEKNGVYFCEAMWTWFSDVALTVKEWVNDGAVGEITDVTAFYKFPGLMLSKSSRVRTPSTAGGALLDVGIYPITYCLNLFGYPDKIECSGTLRDGIDINETVILHYGGFKCTLEIGLDALKENFKINGKNGKINVPMFHMASRASLSGAVSRTYRGSTNYLKEFDCVAREIREGKTQSEFIPFSRTRESIKIMDECRRQLGLRYPFEKDEK